MPWPNLLPEAEQLASYGRVYPQTVSIRHTRQISSPTHNLISGCVTLVVDIDYILPILLSSSIDPRNPRFRNLLQRSRELLTLHHLFALMIIKRVRNQLDILRMYRLENLKRKEKKKITIIVSQTLKTLQESSGKDIHTGFKSASLIAPPNPPPRDSICKYPRLHQ